MPYCSVADSRTGPEFESVEASRKFSLPVDWSSYGGGPSPLLAFAPAAY